MSLPHAILGFLQLLPMSGYDLKTQAFDGSVAHFWPAALPQIYRELEQLEARGWVTHEVQQQSGRPNRNLYRITAAGAAELERWLQSYQPPPAHREAFLIQLFFAAGLPNAAIAELVERQIQVHEQRLAALRQIAIPPAADAQARRRQVLMGMTLDFGLRLEGLYLDWLRDCHATIATLGEASPPPQRGAPDS